MNEIRDILIGLDFGEEKSQLCYYDRTKNEPVSLPMKVGSSQYEAPTCLCRRTRQKGWAFGVEAEYFAREHGGVLVEDLYRISGSLENQLVEGEEKAPWELVALFLKGFLNMLGVVETVRRIKGMAITTPVLTGERVENLKKACESLGFSPDKVCLMDYSQSFFTYVFSQRPDIWSRNVAWYGFLGDRVSFRRLHVDHHTKPSLVRLDEEVHTELGRDAKDRDIDFYQFIQHTMGTDLYSSVWLTGEGFDRKWAVKSTPALCRQQRKVFFGNNLFAKGACYEAREKQEEPLLKNYLYAGDALVKTSVGMELLIMGTPAYYPLIRAGSNWYDCKAVCDILLDEKEELAFLLQELGSKEQSRMIMALPGLPARPRKATRLRLQLLCPSAKECVITVRDLGFGEFFPGSGRVWKETVTW